eukprot:EG_transcript_13152
MGSCCLCCCTTEAPSQRPAEADAPSHLSPPSPPPDRIDQQQLSALQQVYVDIKAQYDACGPEGREAHREAFLAVLDAHPKWQPPAWDGAAPAHSTLAVLWQSGGAAALSAFDDDMLTWLNLFAPGRYPFPSPTVQGDCEGKLAGLREERLDAFLRRRRRTPRGGAAETVVLCHYCEDRRPNAIYRCCGHRAACMACVTQMQAINDRCPNCRAVNPTVHPL